jgi:hypothetical protein
VEHITLVLLQGKMIGCGQVLMYQVTLQTMATNQRVHKVTIKDIERSRRDKMPWYYFNNSDKSLCYMSTDGKLADSEILKLGDVTERYQETHPEIPSGRSDEYRDLYILEDDTIGLRDDVVRLDTKLHRRQLLDFLQMYGPLDEIDRPADFDMKLNWAYTYLTTDIVDEFLVGEVVSMSRKAQIIEELKIA